MNLINGRRADTCGPVAQVITVGAVGADEAHDILTAMAAMSARCIYRINGYCQDGCPGAAWCEYADLPKVADIAELKEI